MIKFSQNAQVVVLVTDMQASLLTPELVATALDAFHNRPALALLVRPPLWRNKATLLCSFNQPATRSHVGFELGGCGSCRGWVRVRWG